MGQGGRLTNNRNKGGLTWLTHERKVDVQAAFIVNERGITDTVRLNPITNVFAKLEMTRLGAKQLV